MDYCFNQRLHSVIKKYVKAFQGAVKDNESEQKMNWINCLGKAERTGSI